MVRERTTAHEQLSVERQELKTSDRAFGFLFAMVFGALGAYGLWQGHILGYYFLVSGGGFLFIALAFPRLLHPLNRLWFLFGLLLHKIVNPVVLAMLFFLTVVPMGLLMRLFKKDPLRLVRNESIESYWIDVEPPGPRPDSIKNQF